MPPKIVTALLKLRNLRFLIFCLVLGTIAIAVYHLCFGNLFDPSPTQYSVSDETFGTKSPHIFDGVIPQHRNVSTSVSDETSVSHSHHYKNEDENWPSIPNYAKGKPGTCLKHERFTPDFDAESVYPLLSFDADWIRVREYWNKFFEQRYVSVKQSPNSPYLKVIVIPHSHNDPGWLRTFEDYFHIQTKNILDNAVEKLSEFTNMTFLWSEISFLSKWWDQAHPERRALLKSLVKEGRLEIVTGGWVMTDEATVNLYSMIDQLVEGHQWVRAHLDVVPKASWSVDPFGHGSAFPYILKASGINAMVIQRIHYAWKKWLAENQKGDFHWVQHWDSGYKNSILCHNAPFDIYSIKHSCGPHPHICLNFDFRNISGEYSENYMVSQPITIHNVKAKAELMLEQYGRTASLFPHNVAMISMGDDFRFDRPIEWDQQYHNYMKLFEYINSKKDYYRAEVKFGTVSDYFKAVKERFDNFPSFSGDFFVYSDIFTEGRPAYWSGYFSTRPFWKKFYRETENNIRSAEILFTLAQAMASKNKNAVAVQTLTQEYTNLVTARRWLGLFAHHDATTGTSKVNTMNDYGFKLMEATQFSLNIQMMAISSIIFGHGNHSNLSTDYELSTFGELPRKLPLKLPSRDGKLKKVVLFNNLAWQRYQLIKLVVTTPHVRVLGQDGKYIKSQLNPILDITGMTPFLSPQIFELTFLASLHPLSVSIFTIEKVKAGGRNEAIRSVVYCRNCTSSSNVFEINKIQAGDIQLNNDKLQLLFDRNTGLLLNVAKPNENISTKTKLTFGGYTSVDFRSGAYLLKPDTRIEQQIPFAYSDAKVFIVSGPISSEISVFHAPITLSTKIMHTGGVEMEEAIFIENRVDLGRHNAEVFMRFETDLESTTKSAKSRPANDIGDDQEEIRPQPTFYTDQNGFTIEKRVKIPSIRLEGNYYPCNTMSYIQDENRQVRFSLLVDRSHGCSSFEVGRLECMIERRTVFDDSRGMGEGVTDNRETISNYVILFEKIGSTNQIYHDRAKLPTATLAAHHSSLELNYPASMFIYDGARNSGTAKTKSDTFPLINQELPCDSHLINLRTLPNHDLEFNLNFPSSKALMIVQKLGYLCNIKEKSGCGNPNPLSLFYPDTRFNGVRISSISQTDLTGVKVKPYVKNLTAFNELLAEPFEIKSVVVDFS